MKVAFIGGGNMASAIIGGLVGREFPRSDLLVVELDTNEHILEPWPIGGRRAAQVCSLFGEAGGHIRHRVIGRARSNVLINGSATITTWHCCRRRSSRRTC